MNKRITTIFLSLVIAVAAIGYFVGIGDGVPLPDGFHDSPLVDHELKHAASGDAKLIEAVSYAEIANAEMGPTESWQLTAKTLPTQTYDLFAEIKPSEEEKLASSQTRSSRRAYNGAPPIIPHAIENTTDAACYACHSNGMKMGSLKASVMSHQFLANCTQCHAPMAPPPFQHVDASVSTTFVGLPAPKAGKRAFPGAPPTIPHSQWMRENCLACHGGGNGWAGMESTHPWRSNCTQCHAPSASLDQAIVSETIPMLPPLEVAKE